MKKLKEMLKNHDWFYQYSDDFRVWSSGSKEHDKIHTKLRELDSPESIALFNKYAPEGHEITN